jgi:hypothetical protein
MISFCAYAQNSKIAYAPLNHKHHKCSSDTYSKNSYIVLHRFCLLTSHARYRTTCATTIKGGLKDMDNPHYKYGQNENQ